MKNSAWQILFALYPVFLVHGGRLGHVSKSHKEKAGAPRAKAKAVAHPSIVITLNGTGAEAAGASNEDLANLTDSIQGFFGLPDAIAPPATSVGAATSPSQKTALLQDRPEANAAQAVVATTAAPSVVSASAAPKSLTAKQQSNDSVVVLNATQATHNSSIVETKPSNASVFERIASSLWSSPSPSAVAAPNSSVLAAQHTNASVNTTTTNASAPVSVVKSAPPAFNASNATLFERLANSLPMAKLVLGDDADDSNSTAAGSNDTNATANASITVVPNSSTAMNASASAVQSEPPADNVTASSLAVSTVAAAAVPAAPVAAAPVAASPVAAAPVVTPAPVNASSVAFVNVSESANATASEAAKVAAASEHDKMVAKTQAQEAKVAASEHDKKVAQKQAAKDHEKQLEAEVASLKTRLETAEKVKAPVMTVVVAVPERAVKDTVKALSASSDVIPANASNSTAKAANQSSLQNTTRATNASSIAETSAKVSANITATSSVSAAKSMANVTNLSVVVNASGVSATATVTKNASASSAAAPHNSSTVVKVAIAEKASPVKSAPAVTKAVTFKALTANKDVSVKSVPAVTAVVKPQQPQNDDALRKHEAVGTQPVVKLTKATIGNAAHMSAHKKMEQQHMVATPVKIAQHIKKARQPEIHIVPEKAAVAKLAKLEASVQSPPQTAPQKVQARPVEIDAGMDWDDMKNMADTGNSKRKQLVAESQGDNPRAGLVAYKASVDRGSAVLDTDTTQAPAVQPATPTDSARTQVAATPPPALSLWGRITSFFFGSSAQPVAASDVAKTSAKDKVSLLSVSSPNDLSYERIAKTRNLLASERIEATSEMLQDEKDHDVSIGNDWASMEAQDESKEEQLRQQDASARRQAKATTPVQSSLVSNGAHASKFWSQLEAQDQEIEGVLKDDSKWTNGVSDGASKYERLTEVQADEMRTAEAHSAEDNEIRSSKTRGAQLLRRGETNFAAETINHPWANLEAEDKKQVAQIHDSSEYQMLQLKNLRRRVSP